MKRVEIWLRSKLRRFGLTRYLRPQRQLLSLWHRGIYDVRRPTRIEVGFGGASAWLTVRNRAEYVTLMAKREDRRFMQLLARNLAAGDCFWDVGSNVGYYALLAAQIVGRQGSVVAFEPEPATGARLAENLRLNAVEHVRVLDLALGREAGEFTMDVDPDPMAGVHRLSISRERPVNSLSRAIQVSVRPGDALVTELGQPSVVKIDVEGAELDVIEGMRATLSHPKCRALLCEVHFGLLEARGTPLAPRLIEQHLRTYGLSEQRWVDASHLWARRP